MELLNGRFLNFSLRVLVEFEGKVGQVFQFFTKIQTIFIISFVIPFNQAGFNTWIILCRHQELANLMSAA